MDATGQERWKHHRDTTRREESHDSGQKSRYNGRPRDQLTTTGARNRSEKRMKEYRVMTHFLDSSRHGSGLQLYEV